MSAEEKVRMIVELFGEMPSFYDETDFSGIDVVRRKWNTLSSDQKNSFKHRARVLNSRPMTGQFTDIPTEIIASLPTYYREAMKADTDKLKKSFSRMMKALLQQKAYHKNIYMPHKIKLQTLLYRQFTVATLVLDAMFGRELEKFHVNESVSMYGSRRGSSTFHIFSRDRVMKILSLSDVNMAVTYCEEMGDRLYLCPIGILVDRQGRNYKAYALEENSTSITLFFSIDTTGKLSRTTVSKPVLIDSHNPNFGYDLINCTNEDFYLQEFYPVCMKISRDNITNFKICSGRVCLCDDESQIIVRKSS